MGVKGLLKLLSDASEKIDLSSLSGRTVAVDMYSWLHKGVLACARELALGKDADLHVKYCVKFIRSLVAHNITPIMVFDGAPHPMKADENGRREDHRRKSLNTALTLEKQGSPSAHRHFASAVDVKPEGDACMVVARVRADPQLKHVQAVTAPYEADAQLSYLVRTNVAYCAISEDSDLLIFGCPRVLFSLGNDGKGRMYELERVGSVEVDGISLSSAPFTLPQLAALAGCDYISSLPGIALTRACRVLRVRGGAADACRWLCARVSSEEVDRVCASVGVLDATGVVGGDELTRRAARYAAAVSRVCMVFRHQTVWNVRTHKLDHLTPLPNAAALLALAWGAGLRADSEAEAEVAVRAVVGPWWEDDDARRRCMCEANPITGIAFPTYLRTYTVDPPEQRRPQPIALGTAARPPRSLSSLRRRTSDVIVTATSSSSSTTPTSSTSVVSLSAIAGAKGRPHYTDSTACKSAQAMVLEQRQSESPNITPELPTLPPPTLIGTSTPQSADSVPNDHRQGCGRDSACRADDDKEQCDSRNHGCGSEEEEQVASAPAIPRKLRPKVDMAVQLQRANAFIARMRGNIGQSTHDEDTRLAVDGTTRIKREREEDEEYVEDRHQHGRTRAQQSSSGAQAPLYRDHCDREDNLDVEHGDSHMFSSSLTGHKVTTELHHTSPHVVEADDVPMWLHNGDSATSYTHLPPHEDALSRYSREQTSRPGQRSTSPALNTRQLKDDRAPSQAAMGLRVPRSHTHACVESTLQEKHSAPLRPKQLLHYLSGDTPTTQTFTLASTARLSVRPASRTRAAATSSKWLGSSRLEAGSTNFFDMYDDARSRHTPAHTSSTDVRYTTPQHTQTRTALACSSAPIGTPYDDHDPADTPSWLRSDISSAFCGSHGAWARGAGRGENGVMSGSVPVSRSADRSSTSWLSDGYGERRQRKASPYSTAAHASVPYARRRAGHGTTGVSWLQDQENATMESAPPHVHTRTPAGEPLSVSSAQRLAKPSAKVSGELYPGIRSDAVRADNWYGSPKSTTPRGGSAQVQCVGESYREHRESEVLVFACGGDASQECRGMHVSPVRHCAKVGGAYVSPSTSLHLHHYSPAIDRVDAVLLKRNDGGVLRTGRFDDGPKTARFPAGSAGKTERNDESQVRNGDKI